MDASSRSYLSSRSTPARWTRDEAWAWLDSQAFPQLKDFVGGGSDLLSLSGDQLRNRGLLSPLESLRLTSAIRNLALRGSPIVAPVPSPQQQQQLQSQHTDSLPRHKRTTSADLQTNVSPSLLVATLSDDQMAPKGVGRSTHSHKGDLADPSDAGSGWGQMPQRSVSPRLARSQDALLLPTLNQPSSTNGGASLRSIFGFRKLSSPTSPDALQPLGAPTPRAQLPPPAWLQWDPSMLTPELQSKYYLSSSEYGSIGELPGHRSSDRRSLFLFQASAESSSERRQPSMWMKSQIGEDSFPTPLPPPPSKSTSPTPSPQLASRVFEKCIKVHSFNGQSHVLDVKMLNTGVSIREAIFRKFRITPEMRPFYALYKLDDRGKVDVDNAVSDNELLFIATSTNMQLKSYIFLKSTMEKKTRQEADTALRKAMERGGIGQPDLHYRAMPDAIALPHLSVESPPPLPAHPPTATHLSSSSYNNHSNRVSFRASVTSAPTTQLESNPPRPPSFASQASSWGMDAKSPTGFGNRPSSQAIAENIEEFFPDLRDRSSFIVADADKLPDDGGSSRVDLAIRLRHTLIRRMSQPRRESNSRRASSTLRNTLSESDSEAVRDIEAVEDEVNLASEDWRMRLSRIGASGGLLMTTDMSSEEVAMRKRRRQARRNHSLTGTEPNAEHLSLSRRRAAASTPEFSTETDGDLDDVESIASDDVDEEVIQRLANGDIFDQISPTERVSDVAPSPLNNPVTAVSRTPLTINTESIPMTASRKSAIASLAYKGFVPVPSSPSDSARRFSLPVRQSLLTSRRESNRSNASALSAKSSDGSSGVPGTASSDVSLPLVSLDAVAPDVPQSVEQQRQEHLVTVEPSKQPVRDSTDRVSRIFSATASGDRRQISWIRGKMIGMGSFAKVFYGVNLLTEEVMAVKQVEMIPVYKHKGAVDRAKHRKKMLDALRMEVLLLRELEHPHIVKYLGFDSEEGGEINLFLEYVDGGSVASMLSRFGKFAEPVVRHITSQILDGLEYLHQHSIIHRDIKGANILVNSNGVAKIADFGISKKNEYNMAYNTNSRMSLQGSIYWMAPEVIKEKGYSAKVDIWSLGCVTLEMFTGTHPWMKLSEFQTMYKLGKENAPPVPDDLSREAREFLELSFTIEPEKRPTAQSLRNQCAFLDPASHEEFDLKDAIAEMERQHLAEATSDSSTSDSDSDDSSPGPPSDIVALGRAGTPDAGLWLHGRAPIRPVPDELKPKDQSPSPVPPQLHSSQLPLRPNSAASSNGRATPQPAPSQLQQQVHIPPRKHFRAVDSDGNMVWTSGNTNANTGVNGTEGSRASAGGSLPGVSRPAATAAGVGGVAMRTRTPSAPLATGSWLLAAQGPSPSDVGSDSAATATDITGNRKSLGSFL